MAGRQKEDPYLKYIAGKEDLIRSACRNGATHKDLAALLGCAVSTLFTLYARLPALKKLVQINRDKADLFVENALYKRAIGYDYIETHTEEKKTPDGAVTRRNKEIHKHVPPDTTAIMSWLRNRKPKEWNQAFIKADTNTAHQSSNMDLSNLSDAELRIFNNLLEKAMPGADK